MPTASTKSGEIRIPRPDYFVVPGAGAVVGGNVLGGEVGGAGIVMVGTEPFAVATADLTAPTVWLTALIAAATLMAAVLSPVPACAAELSAATDPWSASTAAEASLTVELLGPRSRADASARIGGGIGEKRGRHTGCSTLRASKCSAERSATTRRTTYSRGPTGRQMR